MNANFRCSFPSSYKDARYAVIRRNYFVGINIIFGAIGLPVMFVMTGFGYDGWTLNGNPLSDGECKQ